MALAGAAHLPEVRQLVAKSLLPRQQQGPRLPLFADVTSSSGITFTHRASRTSQKYLIKTMGSGVALFDYDGDGYLDIFFVNGARI